MQVIKENPAFDSPREKLVSYFSRGDLFFSSDVHLCFVCGAAAEMLPGGARSLRATFVNHITSDPNSKILCVRAETAATELLRQLEERRGSNISLFEKVIADTVDSVLIFPESPGSFAELGFFSAHTDIAEKTLVAVRPEHQTNSFIMLGPIHLISKLTQFGPIPVTLDENTTEGMNILVRRLLGESLSKRPYRNRYVRKAWKDYQGKQQLAIIDETVDLAGALTEVDLLQVIHQTFGSYDVSRVRLLVSLLVATGRFKRNDDGDIFSTRRVKRFIECDSPERIAALAKWRAAYAEHSPDVLSQLDRVNS